MRKVCQIDSQEVYARTNVFFKAFTKTYRNNTKYYNREWIRVAFTEPQLMLLEQHGYTIRPHPKHSRVVEVFVDDQNMQPEDWSMLRLAF